MFLVLENTFGPIGISEFSDRFTLNEHRPEILGEMSAFRNVVGDRKLHGFTCHQRIGQRLYADFNLGWGKRIAAAEGVIGHDGPRRERQSCKEGQSQAAMEGLQF